MRACAAALCLAILVTLSAPAHADPLDTVEHPTKVPSFSFISLGNGIEPGGSGVYGFTLTNRYNSSIDNVSLTVEIYRFATVEEQRDISELSAPPTFAAGGGTLRRVTFPTIAANGSEQVRLQVDAPRNAPEGVYFTRHLLEFDYGNVTEPPAPQPYTAHFVMKSRGHFSAAEFASINYTHLHDSLAALNISGVIPDSSFSVRPPAPLWPLAALIVATAVAGTMALVYHLVDQRPRKYPRLARAVLRMEGKVAVWRALVLSKLARRPKAAAKPDKAKGSP